MQRAWKENLCALNTSNGIGRRATAAAAQIFAGLLIPKVLDDEQDNEIGDENSGKEERRGD